MAPPSQLAIATSAVNRLVKEEASYHKELEQQQARIEKLKQASSDEENAEWNLKQEVRDTIIDSQGLLLIPFRTELLTRPRLCFLNSAIVFRNLWPSLNTNS